MLKQLFTSNQTDKLSTTKFWYNIACLTCTVMVCWYAFNMVLDWEMFLAYLGSVGGFSSYSKYVMSRRDKQEKSEVPEIVN